MRRICQLLLLCVLGASAGCSRKAAVLPTPEAAFEQMQTAAAKNDFGAFYDSSDDSAQRKMLNEALSLFTMEMAARRSFPRGDTEAIKRAFEEELGIASSEIERAEKDAALRRKLFLLTIDKSQGPARNAFGEVLQQFSRFRVSSVQMTSADSATLTINGGNSPKSVRLSRENGRWIRVSD